MYKWFFPKNSVAEINEDTEWMCVHPFVKSITISDVDSKYSTKWTRKEILIEFIDSIKYGSHRFSGEIVSDVIDRAEMYLSHLYPIKSLKIKTVDGEINISPDSSVIEISVSGENGTPPYTFQYPANSFFRLFLDSKMLDNEICELDTFTQMKIRDFIVYRLFNIRPKMGRYKFDEKCNRIRL